MGKKVLTMEEMEAIRSREELINRWGEDTISMFMGSKKAGTPSNRLCITTLSVCSTYCKAIMTLLQNGLRMPTQALIRILFEVSMKVSWCLYGPGADPDKSESAVDKRINGWAKASLDEDRKLRKDYLNIVTEEERKRLAETIAESEEMLKHWECDSMPENFYRLTKDLGDTWQKEFYPQMYRRFNSAVHLDFASLCNKAKDQGPNIAVANDSDEPLEELAQYCVAIMHIIFFVIREYYGWNTAEMHTEFNRTIQSRNA